MRKHKKQRVALIAGLSVTVLAGAGPANAWPGDWPGNSWQRPMGPYSADVDRPAAKKQKTEKKAGKKADKKADQGPVIPKGALHIIVSVNKQRVTLFANGAPVASAPVSTGTASHPTPMGVFSIIQKNRHHVSNLYDAPMPYMQRITWSGS